MNKEQLAIFTKTNDLYDKLESLIDPTTFVLNPEIEKIQNEIVAMQSRCNHIYKDGKCTICRRVEE